MENGVVIKQVRSVEEHIDELSQLLVVVVEDGASIGFLPPLERSKAADYWRSAVTPDAILFVATINDRIVGTVQLQLCTKQNGGHRAEIAKLMIHPKDRRKGIGRLLMQEAEKRARQEGRMLLVLDTREGDPSNLLYTSVGYIQAGRVPGYAKSANGELHATILYYKSLGDAPKEQ